MNEGEAKTGDESASQPKSGDTTSEAAAAADAVLSEERLRAELEQAQAEAGKLKDQLLRTAADFDNFRKRSRKDLEDAQRKGLERALSELLPVSDNLERAVQAADTATDVAAITEGVRMVLRLVEDAFGRLGVERVQSVGQAFDPGVHEAVQQVESDAAPGTVVSEMVPGYRLGGKLLRAAMVGVARPRAGAEGNGAGEGGSTPAAPVN